MGWAPFSAILLENVSLTKSKKIYARDLVKIQRQLSERSQSSSTSVCFDDSLSNSDSIELDYDISISY